MLGTFGKCCYVQRVKINIEHVTIVLSKYICKGAIDLKHSPDVANSLRNPHTRKEIKTQMSINEIMCNNVK